MLYEQLGYFKEVNEMHEKLLKYFRKMKPIDVNFMNLNKFIISNLHDNDSLFIAQIIANSIGVSIVQCYDRIKGVREEDYKKVFSEFECVNEIVEKYGISYKEAVKQIRNCFSHGEYWLKTDESSVEKINDGTFAIHLLNEDYPFCIHLSNERDGNHITINTDIPFEEFCYLEKAFSDIYRIYNRPLKSDGTIITPTTPFFGCKNRYQLNESLNNSMRVSYVEDENGQDLLSYRDSTAIEELIFRRKFEDYSRVIRNERPLSDKEKDILRHYVEYIGFGNFEKLSNDGPITNYIKTKIDENLSQIVYDEQEPEMMLSSIMYLFFVTNDDLIEDEEIRKRFCLSSMTASYLAPMIYSSLIIANGYYTICNAKEVNKNAEVRGNPIFDFKNFQDIDFIRSAIVIDSQNERRRSFRQVSQETEDLKLEQILEDRYGHRLYYLRRQLTRAQNRIERAVHPNEIQNLQDRILHYQEEIGTIENSMDMDRTEGRQIIPEPYVDCTQLFTHLRNSIIHGTYKVDYIKALEIGDLDKIKFEFYDYELSDIEQTNPTFKMVLSAKQLNKLISCLKDNIILKGDERLSLIKSLDVLSRNNSRSTDKSEEER